jgi:hypothetical protein
MTVTTYEGVVKEGKIELLDAVHVPDQTRVYVVIPQPKKARANGKSTKARKKRSCLQQTSS